MSDERTTGPGADRDEDAPDRERLAALIEQVDADHGDDGAEAMADALRDEVPETRADPEAPGDLVD